MPSGTFGVSVDWVGGTAEIRWYTADDAANNRSTVTVELWAHTTGFTTYGTASFNMRIGNDANVQRSVSIGGSWTLVVSRSRIVDHNADGSLSIQVGVASGEVIGTSWNSASGIQTVALTNYTRLPGAPGTPVASAISPVAMTWTWTEPSFVAAGILEYRLHYSVNSDMSGAVSVSAGTSLSKTLTGLTPGTRYYVRVDARTADGWGSLSAIANADTLAGGRAWNGTSWQNCRVRYWNGTAWQNCQVKQWNGTAWQNVK